MTEYRKFIVVYNAAYDRGVTQMKEVADELQIPVREAYKMKETIRNEEQETGITVLRGDLSKAARARTAIMKHGERNGDK